MPKTSIKEWMNEAEKAHASIQIRGLVNNSFKETIQRMSDLTKDNHGGLQINPKLFEQFQIDKVPAVVVTADTSCPSNISCIAPFDVIYGDVTLAYALQKIADRNDAVSDIAKVELNQLRDNHAA
jgi:conjugal transfer pilus assembly protein TrbC